MLIINKELSTVDWSQLNDTDVNITFDEFQQIIENCLDTLAPLKFKKKTAIKFGMNHGSPKPYQNLWTKMSIYTNSASESMQHQIKKKNTNYIGTV